MWDVCSGIVLLEFSVLRVLGMQCVYSSYQYVNKFRLSTLITSKVLSIIINESQHIKTYLTCLWYAFCFDLSLYLTQSN